MCLSFVFVDRGIGFAAVKTQLGDLLRDQSHQKGQHGGGHQQGGGLSVGGVQHEDAHQAIADAKQENDDAQRHEDFERRVKDGDLQNDHQKAQAVLQRLDLAFGLFIAPRKFDRLVSQAVSRADN